MGVCIVCTVAKFYRERVRVHVHRGEIDAVKIAPGVKLNDDIFGLGRVESILQLLARFQQTVASS